MSIKCIFLSIDCIVLIFFLFLIHKNINQIMKKLILMLSFLSMTISLNAQELESLLLAGDEASKLTESYVNPVMKGLMYSMNGGWYTTAKTHKKFGFDITINANVSIVPDADKLFAFTGYDFLSTPNGETSVPTIMSDDGTETEVDVRILRDDGSSFKVTSFEIPGGIAEDLPLKAVPTPMVQIGFGLPWKTDIKLRIVPKLNFDDNLEASLIGFGLQHDITQYLGPIDKLPLSVSVLGAFTNMKVAYAIEDESASDGVTVTSDGEAEFKMNTFTIQALASLDFKVITVYGGLGYNNGKSTAKLKGDYDLEYEIEDGSGTVIGTANESVSDPINLDFEANGMRATLGTRINIGFFKIFADYSLQEYNTLSAGIAFSFR